MISRWPVWFNTQTMLFVCLFLNIHAALAQTYTLTLDKVALPVLSAAVFRGVLQKDYVLSPDVIADDRKLSFWVTDKEPAKVLEALKNTLAASGLIITERAGVYYVEKPQTLTPGEQLKPGVSSAPVPQPADSQPIKPLDLRTYKIKHRPITYLSSLVKFAGGSVVDNPSGEFLVYSAPENRLDKIEQLLKVVDSAPQALTIRAAIIEYSQSADSSKSMLAAFDLLAGKLSLNYKAGSSLVNSVTYKGASIQAAMSAIEGDTRFNYLAQPVLRVVDGKPARIQVGSDVPVRGQSTLDKNGNPVQSIEYRTSGLVVDLKPEINGETVTLSVDQQISSFAQTTTSNIDSPTLLKRQAETTVDIKRGELLVMAGLDEQRNSDSVSGFSWLPSFMRSSTKSSTNSQILLLIEILPS